MNTCESRRNHLKYYKIYILHQHTKFKCHFRMTKTISDVCDVLMLITFFVDGFTPRMKSQSMTYLLGGSAHIYWI
jgi:hypothetical protein